MLPWILPLAMISAAAPLEQDSFDQGVGAEIEYRLFRPTLEAGKTAPLVVYLHANSENPMFSLPWFQAQLQSAEPSFLLLPHCLREGGQAADWGGTYDASLRPTLAEVVDIVDSLQTVHPIDSRRIYVYGGSMGAEAVFALLAYRPGLAAAAVAVAGFTRNDAPKAKAMAKTPFWILHGGDDDLNPTSSSRNIFRAIRTAGGRKVRYTEYPGYSHSNIWGRVPSESTLVPWMLSQVLDSTAPGVSPFAVQGIRLSGDTLTWSAPGSGNAPWFYTVYRADSLLEQVASDDTIFALGSVPSEGTVFSISATDKYFRESEPTRLVASSGVRSRIGRGRAPTWRRQGGSIWVEWPTAEPWQAQLRTASGQVLSNLSGIGPVADLAYQSIGRPAFLVLRQEGTQQNVMAIPLLLE